MKIELSVISGPGTGQVRRFSEPRGFIIGRAPDCDFQLPPNDPYVSRHHVYLEICPPACRLRDLGIEGGGSTNKPHLNGEPVTEADLTDGDVLELGYTKFAIGITRDVVALISRPCASCGRPIEYFPGEAVPTQCDVCSEQTRRYPAVQRIAVKCAQCGCDMSNQADSDGRAQEFAAIAHCRCVRCLPRGDEFAGKVIQSYRIVRRLGEGGMGTVFLVHHPGTGRLWALKKMKDLNEVDLNRRFERGMRLHRDLAHPNIVRCVETGLDVDGIPYVVTEFVGGGELGEPVHAGSRLPPEIAVPLICGVLDGLDFLHARNIVHRDIKPPNVLLDRPLFGPEGSVTLPLAIPKIVDFDLAKAYGRAGGTYITKLNTMMGTLMYMPPEQVRDAASVREPADLYAVGVMLYYLMTGCYSFSFPTPDEIREFREQEPARWRNAQEALAALMKHDRIQHPFRIILEDEPVPMCERNGSFSARLAAIVDRAVSKDPARRFQSAVDFRDALRAAL